MSGAALCSALLGGAVAGSWAPDGALSAGELPVASADAPTASATPTPDATPDPGGGPPAPSASGPDADPATPSEPDPVTAPPDPSGPDPVTPPAPSEPGPAGQPPAPSEPGPAGQPPAPSAPAAQPPAPSEPGPDAQPSAPSDAAPASGSGSRSGTQDQAPAAPRHRGAGARPPAGGGESSRPARGPVVHLTPHPVRRDLRAGSRRAPDQASQDQARRGRAPDQGGAAPAPALPALPQVPLTGVRIPAPAELVEGFSVPPFLLPLYQAAAARYGVDWELLAAINQIETDFGRNLRRSSAGAVGWMQFMPSTWARYGVDADRDGAADPYDPVDAIFAAARYLRAAGAPGDVRGAVLAYNHAGWYADWVLRRAALIRAMPGDVVGSLTGLGAGRSPLQGALRYAGASGGSSVALQAAASAPVLAVADGTISRTGRGPGPGRFLVLRDDYGNRFMYGGLGALSPGLRRGRTVVAGRVLARLGSAAGASLRFAIRPAGPGAPLIAPRPILSGWRVLARLHAERVLDPAALAGPAPMRRILGLSDQQLAARVLSDRGIRIYPCGRLDVRLGRIDRRVLAAMLYLDASGMHPTITSLECGHGLMTVSGNVSEHATGTAMDIGAVNGVRITPATQGPGSITAATIERLLALTGGMRPHQIISLMTFPGADDAFSMPDHGDHIHVGWRPAGTTGPGRAFALSPGQWRRLMDRVGAR